MAGGNAEYRFWWLPLALALAVGAGWATYAKIERRDKPGSFVDESPATGNAGPKPVVSKVKSGAITGGTLPRGDLIEMDSTGKKFPAFGEFVYVDELPQAITRMPPTYPELAFKAGVEGTVLIQALVGEDGRVLDTKVVKSVPVFDDAAVQAVHQWTFKPAMANDKAVAVWVAIPVRFSLP